MQIFFKSKLLLFVNILFTSVLMYSCGSPENSWKIKGNIKDYANKPVYISILGNLDSAFTNNEGNFSFERINQKSGFVKLALDKKMYPYANLFADSICKVIVNIPASHDVSRAIIENSPVSNQLKELYSWFNAEKLKYDSLAMVYKELSESSLQPDTIRKIYISQLDSLQLIQYNYLHKYILENIDSPAATTASFVSFNTQTYMPLLVSQPHGIDLMNTVLEKMKVIYGNVPFVELYANSIRSLELRARP